MAGNGHVSVDVGKHAALKPSYSSTGRLLAGVILLNLFVYALVALSMFQTWRPHETGWHVHLQINVFLLSLTLMFSLMSFLFSWQLHVKRRRERQIEVEFSRRKAVESALKESEMRFREIFEHAPIGIFQSVPEGRFQMVNSTMAEMLGYSSPEELIAATSDMTTQIYVDTGLRPKIVADLMARNEWRHYDEVAWRRKDGSVIIVDMTGRKVLTPEGQLAYLEGFIIDITERVEVTRKLKENDEMWSALDKTGCVIVYNDIERQKIRFSNGWKAMLGYAEHEIDNWQTTDAWHRMIPPEDIHEILPQLRASIESRTPISMEHRVRRKDGSLCWVLAHGQIIRWSPQGAPLMGCGVLTDITHIKQMEADLMQLNKTLNERVELETSRRLAQERMLARQAKLAAMGEMVGAIAHQWRQPLTTLSLIIQNIRKTWDGKRMDSAFIARTEADARKQITHMSDTIETFRNYIRPDKQGEPFLVGSLVSESVNFMSIQLKGNAIELVLTGDAAGDVQVQGSGNEFKQVLLNLFSNARDAIMERRASGVQRQEADRIEVAIRRNDGWITMSVKDNGNGIPDSARPHMFEPYFSTKDDTKGTGIGLYISRMIVEDGMGGKLTFESSPAGTTFHIQLKEL